MPPLLLWIGIAALVGLAFGSAENAASRSAPPPAPVPTPAPAPEPEPEPTEDEENTE